MDFYNLQESDHRLFEGALKSLTPGGIKVADTETKDRNYLKKYVVDTDRLITMKNILVVEEDPRIQRALRSLLMESAAEGAKCHMVEAVEEILEVLERQPCELVIANYYLSEDEIEYEIWESIRSRYPKMEVVIVSHVNDREYYDILEKLSESEEAALPQRPLVAKLKSFIENVFGG